jgi:amino acid transporter
MSDQPNANAPELEQVERDIADLHEFGYSQSLRRTIGSFTSFALGFAMVSITAAIFTVFASPFENVGGAAIWLWFPVMIGVGAITLVYGHLSARMPLTGYAYQWSSRLVNPHFGWATGWAAMLAFTAGTAGLSIAMATVFAPYIWDDPSRGQIQLFGIGMIVIGCIINAVGVRAATWINNIGAGVELIGTVGIAIVTAIGLFFFKDLEGPSVLVHTGRLDGGPISFTAIMLAALLPVYTLIGWEGSADLAEETRDPRKTAPRAMIKTVLITTAVGFFIFAVFSMAIPHGIANTFEQSESPIIYLLKVQFGSFVANLMKFVAFIAFLSALLANIAVCTRLIFSLARDRMLPGHQVLSKVNGATRTPLYVIVLVGAISVILNLMSAGIVTRIVSIVAICYYLTYILTMIAALIADRRGSMPAAPAGYMDLGKWLIPVSVVGIGWGLLTIGYLSIPSVNRTAGEYSLYALGAGAVWYVVYLGWQIRAGNAGPSLAPLGPSESSSEHEIAVESVEDPLE